MKRSDDETIAAAVKIIEKRFARRRYSINHPSDAADYLRLKFAKLDHEEFFVLFLDNKHRVIANRKMAIGSICDCTVYPREICREALRYNAAAIIVAHNHPSGDPEPSHADVRLTDRIIEALGILEIRVLDHIVVGGARHVSLADRDMLYRREATESPKKLIARKTKRRQRDAA